MCLAFHFRIHGITLEPAALACAHMCEPGIVHSSAARTVSRSASLDLKAKPARGYPMFKLVGHPHMSQTPNLLPGLNVGMHAVVHNWRVAGRDAADAPPEEVNTDQPGLLGLVGL